MANRLTFKTVAPLSKGRESPAESPSLPLTNAAARCLQRRAASSLLPLKECGIRWGHTHSLALQPWEQSERMVAPDAAQKLGREFAFREAGNSAGRRRIWEI